MKIGDLVNYHLNASAGECREDLHGTAVPARVTGTYGERVNIQVEGSDLHKAHVAVTTSAEPGCASAFPREAPEEHPELGCDQQSIGDEPAPIEKPAKKR